MLDVTFALYSLFLTFRLFQARVAKSRTIALIVCRLCSQGQQGKGAIRMSSKRD